MIRRALDLIYYASGVLAIAFLVMIAVLTLAQAMARLLGGIVPSADDFAGFCMAGAVFLGLAHTLRAGGHIRVLLLLTRLGPAARRLFELVTCLAATALVAALTWYTVEMIATTRRLGEHTLGLVPVPKWIPMLLMLAGLSVLLLTLLDEFVRVVRGGKPTYAQREEEAGSLPMAALD